jgi:hypothetical protein
MPLLRRQLLPFLPATAALQSAAGVMLMSLEVLPLLLLLSSTCICCCCR